MEYLLFTECAASGLLSWQA